MAGCHIELWQIERRIRNVRCLKGATVTSISEYCHQIRTLELVNNLRFNFENDGMRSKCILIQPRFFFIFQVPQRTPFPGISHNRRFFNHTK